MLQDNRAGVYGVFIVLGAFAVSIVAVGYFIGAANIYTLSRGEALGHVTAYQGIGRADLMRIVEEAALVASKEAGEAGWGDDEVDQRFRELVEMWIAEYMADRGVYDVEIQVLDEQTLKEEDKESIIVLGRYVVEVKGQGAETEVLVE